jgi:uncharacterized protein
VIDSQGRFVWYELITTDKEVAKAFYQEVLGWEPRDVRGMSYTVFTVGNAPVGGLLSVPEDAKLGWIGHVGVDDLDAALDRARQLGGAVVVQPMEVLELGRFAVVADPQMATIALFQGPGLGEEPYAELDSPGRVGWHELFVTDRNRVSAFYSELFGWQTAETNMGTRGVYQLLTIGGQTFGGMVFKPPIIAAPFWLYYFNVADIDAASKRVKAGGGQILYGPVEVLDSSWIVHCTDPQGVMFALVGKRKYKAIVFVKPVDSYLGGKRSAE